MSSPQAQPPIGNVLDLGEIPSRLPHSAFPSHMRLPAAPMAPAYGAGPASRAHAYNSPGLAQQHASYPGSGTQEHITNSGNPLPYMTSPHVMAPIRLAYTPLHLSGGVQRIDSRSDVSGSHTGDSTMVFKAAVNASSSTMAPPGDEHTHALLQSLMSFTTTAPQAPETSRILQAATGATLLPHGAVSASVADAVDELLSQVQAQGLMPPNGVTGGIASPQVAFVLQMEDGGGSGFPGPVHAQGSGHVGSGHAVSVAQTYGTVTAQSFRMAAIASDAAAAKAHQAEPRHLPPPLRVGATQPLQEPTLMIKGLNVSDLRLQPAPQLILQPRGPQQPAPTETLARSGSGLPPRADLVLGPSRGSSAPLPRAILHQGLPIQPIAPAGMDDVVMSESPRASGGHVESAPGAAPAGAITAAAAAGTGRDGDGNRQPAHGNRVAVETTGRGTPGARTRRRVDTASFSAMEHDSSNLRGGDDSPELLRTSVLERSRQDSGGLVFPSRAAAEGAGESSRRQGVQAAAVKVEPGSEGSGQRGVESLEGQKKQGRGAGGLDTDELATGRLHDEQDEDEDGEDETTDGEAYTHQHQKQQARKRTASQRRRGSATAKKELCRERNRTAQRRFRMKQKDLIRVLQEQVEHQEALIKDLESRLAVYEKPQQQPPGAEE